MYLVSVHLINPAGGGVRWVCVVPVLASPMEDPADRIPPTSHTGADKREEQIALRACARVHIAFRLDGRMQVCVCVYVCICACVYIHIYIYIYAHNIVLYIYRIA